ncbi:MAG TPA: LysE family transporter [Gammaproteobacteria bacterium]|nr:LysE family transporter [Gammaproteobacteria bacterium]
MTAIFAYAIGVMYTPGPVNLLGLNAGINGRLRASVGYFVGVGSAMLILLLVFGWVGSAWVEGPALVVISALGSAYIVYLAVKIARESVSLDGDAPTSRSPALGFREGLVMQLMNPKGIVATLPIAAIQFPAAGVHGVSLLAWSAVIAVLAIGAPGSYCVVGHWVGRRAASPRVFRSFNTVMAGLLIYVAVKIAYHHVYLPLVS